MRGNPWFKFLDRVAGIPLVFLAGLWRRLVGAGGNPIPGEFRAGERVLVIKLSALGDTLILMPVLKAIRQRLGPQGRLEVLATRVNLAAFKEIPCPWVDALHLVEPGNLATRPWKMAELAGRLRAGRFDRAIDFDQWLRISPLLAFLSGARRLFGFRTSGQHRHGLYDGWVRLERGRHESDNFRDLAQKAGLRGRIPEYAGFLAKAGEAVPRPYRSPRILFHPGCGAHGWQREWPIANFKSLGARLKSEMGASLAVTGGGAHEAGLAESLAGDGTLRIENLVGRLDLKGLARELARADLLVCGNTGIMHLAVGLGRPVVALHGPTDPVKWGPLAGPAAAPVLRANLPCSPCLDLGFEYGCKARPCMEAISVDEVFEACRKIIVRGHD